MGIREIPLKRRRLDAVDGQRRDQQRIASERREVTSNHITALIRDALRGLLRFLGHFLYTAVCGLNSARAGCRLLRRASSNRCPLLARSLFLGSRHSRILLVAMHHPAGWPKSAGPSLGTLRLPRRSS